MRIHVPGQKCREQIPLCGYSALTAMPAFTELLLSDSSADAGLRELCCLGAKFPNRPASIFGFTGEFREKGLWCSHIDTFAEQLLPCLITELLGIDLNSDRQDTIAEIAMQRCPVFSLSTFLFGYRRLKLAVMLSFDPLPCTLLGGPVRIVVARVGRPPRAVHLALDQADLLLSALKLIAEAFQPRNLVANVGNG